MSSPPSPQPAPPRSGLWRQMARLLAATLCVTAAVAIWAILAGHFDATEGRALGSTLLASLFTFVGLIGATLLDQPGARRILGQATIALSAFDFALALAAIWSQFPSHNLGKVLEVTSVLLPALAHACLMVGRLRPSDSLTTRRLTWLAIGCASTAALFVAGAIAFVTGPVDTVFVRLEGVLVVLAVLATLLAPLARRQRPPRCSA